MTEIIVLAILLGLCYTVKVMRKRGKCGKKDDLFLTENASIVAERITTRGGAYDCENLN